MLPHERTCCLLLLFVARAAAAARAPALALTWFLSLAACPQIRPGFVSNMSEWMGACDCVVTKAGPGTIAEALIRGVPLLLNGCVPCQEEGNIPYVVDNGVGAFNTDPEQIAKIISRWFSKEGEGELEAMAQRARKLGRPQATFDIVRDLAVRPRARVILFLLLAPGRLSSERLLREVMKIGVRLVFVSAGPCEQSRGAAAGGQEARSLALSSRCRSGAAGAAATEESREHSRARRLRPAVVAVA